VQLYEHGCEDNCHGMTVLKANAVTVGFEVLTPVKVCASVGVFSAVIPFSLVGGAHRFGETC
jgi:hypothetical protein